MLVGLVSCITLVFSNSALYFPKTRHHPIVFNGIPRLLSGSRGATHTQTLSLHAHLLFLVKSSLNAADAGQRSLVSQELDLDKCKTGQTHGYQEKRAESWHSS